MTVHIRTLRDWRCRLDPDGNAVREYPRGRTFSVDDHLGLLALAEGAAETVVDLSPRQAFHLEVVRASIAGDEAKLAALLGEAASADAGTVPPETPAESQPAAKVTAAQRAARAANGRKR